MHPGYTELLVGNIVRILFWNISNKFFFIIVRGGICTQNSIGTSPVFSTTNSPCTKEFYRHGGNSINEVNNLAPAPIAAPLIFTML